LWSLAFLGLFWPVSGIPRRAYSAKVGSGFAHGIPLQTNGVFGTAPWLPLSLQIYAGGMNEAIRPGPENPPRAIATPQLSVIVPTFNERDNVTQLFRRLEATLAGVAWEVIFVDDNSPDGT
jgi:dolichol-phosphate mannosyltransferase